MSKFVAARPQLLTLSQAASLLNVSEKTVRRWIEAEQVPFLRLPGGQYRLPQGALLASLEGTYDLGAELAELDRLHADKTDEEVTATFGTDTGE